MQATVGALGVLSKDSRINAGRVVFISGDCGRETGHQHAQVIKTVYDGINSVQNHTNLRIVSIASDGESRRGSALIELTFKKLLQEDSKIYRMLSPLTLLDLHVGDNDLTCDKDWKHVFKRLRNLLLRERGVLINDVRITPSIIRTHLNSTKADPRHIHSVLNPEDLQDVGLAFNLLCDIWSLPDLGSSSSEEHSPGYQKGREALQILGKLVRHLLSAYLCVELSLSEQLAHLSAAAHLLFVLYKTAGSSFIPTQLYIDIILMIKNVFFSMAKAKSDNPNGAFFVVLLGTDRLEIHFGILRTVVGNDCNLDTLQMADRTSGVHDVADILAEHPEWDQGTKRLRLPALTRTAEEIPNSADHLSPKHLLGDYDLQKVTLLTCWKQGRTMAEEDYAPAAAVLKAAESKPGVNMLAPAGVLLVTAPLATDDVDESSETLALQAQAAASSTSNPTSASHPESPNDGEIRIDIENEIAELEASVDNPSSPSDSSAFTHHLLVDGKTASKAKLVAFHSRFRTTKASADRLKRVQEIERYATTTTDNASSFDTDAELLLIHDPIATLLACEGKLWLALGEVNGIRYNNQPLDRIGHALLAEPALKITFQLLGLRATTSDDDNEMVHDWRTYSMPSSSYTIPGKAVEPLDPKTSISSTKPYYLFQSPVLITTTALLIQRFTTADLKNIPKTKVTTDYPYMERWGEWSGAGVEQ